VEASERRRRASEEAAEWWTRLQAEDVPRSTREEFTAWLRESPIHVAEMLRMAQVHRALELFERWAQIPSEIASEGAATDAPVVKPFPRFEALPRVIPRRAVWIGAAVAATIVAVTSGVAVLVASRNTQVIQTERGERRELVLSDSSVVDVDPETRLRVRFEEHARRVALERGRVLFRVAKSPDRPFIVQVDGTLVRAIGTAFGVERGRRGVVVTVAEGKVAVSPSRAAWSSSSAQFPVVTAGEQVTVTSAGSAQPVRRVDTNRELAWAQGHLVFDNDTVAAVVEQFNRYNRVQLHVEDPALAMRPVSGVFDAADPESFIAFIAGTTGVRVVRRGDRDITLSRGDREPP
jgi:transmembrane sensor